jgi:hypothetical protein
MQSLWLCNFTNRAMIWRNLRAQRRQRLVGGGDGDNHRAGVPREWQVYGKLFVPQKPHILPKVMKIIETIHCRGHKNVMALHKSTFEITKETELSPNGDCIIAIGADKGAADLSPAFREALNIPGTILTTVLDCGGVTATVLSKGCSGITLAHETDLVWRHSTFLCPRTIAVCSGHTACQLPRELIEKLRNGEEMTVTLQAESP